MNPNKTRLSALAGKTPCPMCGAENSAAAPKCRTCGEVFAVSPKPNKVLGRLITVLTVLAIGVVMIALMLPAVRRGREPSRRSQCKNNLKQIGLALHNYKDEYHAFPPAYTVDADGRPLHSWRTLILPYLDQAALYNSIDLSKPWDDPVNAEACKTVIPVYSCPSGRGPADHTTYLASVGANACFRPGVPRPASEITDGLSETLMIIEVPSDLSVPWMSPRDADEALVLRIGHESKLDHAGGLHAALCDGAVRFFSVTTPAEERRALISVAKGDKSGNH
jgi:hypothetical protein